LNAVLVNVIGMVDSVASGVTFAPLLGDALGGVAGTLLLGCPVAAPDPLLAGAAQPLSSIIAARTSAARRGPVMGPLSRGGRHHALR
jgi:hypothetical protein